MEVETISGYTLDTSPSLVLKIQGNQYVFNVPEMFQRNLLSKHIKLKKLRCVFLTSTFPDSVGGLSVYILQTYYQKKNIFQVVGPKELPEVMLFDPLYVGEGTAEKFKNEVSDTFANKDISVRPIFLSKSICYDILIIKLNRNILIIDCRSIEDLSKFQDLSKFDTIFHITIPEILTKKEYISFFTSHVRTKDNFCFMPSGIFTNLDSAKYYETRSKRILQPLAYGKTMKPPNGFINITSEKAVYDIIQKRLQITNEGEIIDINYDSLKNLNGLQIISHLFQSEPTLLFSEKYVVTFLGTSTKFVSVLQNDSGYLIHTKQGFIVLDPSEGFINQIKRKFGPKTTEYILKNIECIWISHFHHDHCFGAPSLLYERSKITDKEIFFLAPQKFIDDIKSISDLYGDFHLIYHNREGESNDEFGVASIKINENLCFHTIDVYHNTPFAKGCMIEINGNTKIAFSGDRAFQKDHFADAFKNCDLLIHEATFPDRLKSVNESIQNKKHSELGEAIMTSDMMKPKFTVFTHLSQRYTNEEIARKISDDKMFAFDFLEFSSENATDIFKQIQ